MSATLGIWWRERAREMAATGMKYAEIARTLGVDPSAVSKACQPEKAREWVQRDNARRRAAKQAWEDEHYRGECTVCGASTGKRKWDRCKRHQHQKDRAWLRRKRIEELWAAEYTIRAIAEDLGTTVGSIGIDIVRMRKAGWDLPYRYNVQNGKRVA